MRYLKTFEKLGASYIVDDVTEEVWEEIRKRANDEIRDFEFYYPVENLPQEFTLGKPIKFFKICINRKSENAIDFHFSEDKKSIEVILYLDPFGDGQISLLSHEILHFYQYVRQINMKSGKIYFKNQNLNNLYYTAIEHDEKFLDILQNLLKFIYISLEDEVSARTQECYRELVEMEQFSNKTTKENFLKNLKKTDAWEYLKLYDVCFDDTMKIIYKDPVKWYKKLMYAWKNEKKKGLFAKIKSFFIDAEVDSIEVNKQEAIALFKEIELFIRTQEKKYRRKLYRLYDNF